MPRAAAHPDDALLNRQQVEALIHRDPNKVTSLDDTRRLLRDGVRYLGARKFWLKSAVAAFCRALPRKKVGATSLRSIRRRELVDSGASS